MLERCPLLRVVALSGKAGSGKDHLARSSIMPLKYMQWAISWHLKQTVIGKEHGDWTEVHMTKPPAVRRALQIEGTELGWMVSGKTYWCRIAEAWLETMYTFNQWHNFVITDVRFPWEVDWVKSVGGLVVRVNAPEREAASSLTTESRQHISETALDNYTGFDHVINNDPGSHPEPTLLEIVRDYTYGGRRD